MSCSGRAVRSHPGALWQPQPVPLLCCTGSGCLSPKRAAATARSNTHTAWRVVKAFVYINDVAENQGPTSIVPGSHRLAGGPHWLTRWRQPSSVDMQGCHAVRQHTLTESFGILASGSQAVWERREQVRGRD